MDAMTGETIIKVVAVVAVVIFLWRIMFGDWE